MKVELAINQPERHIIHHQGFDSIWEKIDWELSFVYTAADKVTW